MTVDTRPDQMNFGLLDPGNIDLDPEVIEHRRIQVIINGAVMGLDNPNIPNRLLMDSDPLPTITYDEIKDYGAFLHETEGGNKILVVTQNPDALKSPEVVLTELRERAARRINGIGRLTFLRAGEVMPQLERDKGNAGTLLKETKRFGRDSGHEYLGTVQIMQAAAGEMPFVPYLPPVQK